MSSFVDVLSLLLPTFAAAVALVCATAFQFLKRRYRFWSERGVPGPQPSMIFGNILEACNFSKTEAQMTNSWYQAFRSQPYVGAFYLWKPVIFLIDPELVRKVTIKDFQHFVNHSRVTSDSQQDAVLDSLFTMKGERWYIKRHIFSKLFTPRKLKEHVEAMNNYYPTLMKDIDSRLDLSDGFEIASVMGKFVLRSDMSTLFGIDLMNDEDRLKILDKHSDLFAHPPFINVLNFLLYSVSPELCSFFKLSTCPADLWTYFCALTEELLNIRSSTKHEHEDVVSLIQEYRSTQDKQLNEKINFTESVGHVFSFFVASYHTTLTILNYMIFEVARHPEVQEKIRQEVDAALNGSKEITYEALSKMSYLSDVRNESLRLHTLLGVLKRTCTKEYKVDDKLTIPEGMDVIISAEAFHMDPEYFPEPEKFLPERFSGLEKLPPQFMPFGLGPRICIGFRLGELTLNAIVAKLVSEYEILPSPKTTHPIDIDKKSLFITCRPLKEIYLKFKKRDER